MKHFFVFLALIICSVSMCAQPARPQPIELSSTGDTYYQVPADRINYLIEPDQTPLSLKQILMPQYQESFRPLSSLKDGLVSGSKIVWLRYHIKNTSNSPLGITIPQNIKKAEIFVSGPDSVWHDYITGSGVDYSQRSGFKRLMQIHHTIPPNGELVVYERDDNGNRGMRLAVLVGLEDKVRDAEYVDNRDAFKQTFIAGLFAGIFLFGCLFNLFFYYTVREKTYLFYSLLLLSIGLNYLSIPIASVFMEQYYGFEPYQQFLDYVLQFYLFVIVSLLFLQSEKIHRKWFYAILGVATVWMLLYIVRMFFGLAISSITTFVLKYTRYILIVAILVIIIVDFVKKRRPARLMMIANVPFIIAFLAFIFLGSSELHILMNVAIVWSVVVLSWSLFDRYKHLQSENMRQAVEKERLAREKEIEKNELIASQNEKLEREVAERTEELRHSLQNLQVTQNQLVQSEKMASLGELTAGIAHEIQNPLNFVNNFSDVSIELLEEMQEEIDKGDLEEARAIAEDVKQNLSKINFHGKRADGIVKGMLQHSRSSSGKKEATDINALADEYLRLAYHGLRAKDKTFNAELVVNTDPHLPKIDVLAQDMGRVLLNMFTNAFYSTRQKQNRQDAADYKPILTLSTAQVDDKLEIRVADNGMGIPDSIRDKILQPFFTTKPTGEGTGLGLSLSYDIVVKAHNGTIDIESIEGERATFIIRLPMNS